MPQSSDSQHDIKFQKLQELQADLAIAERFYRVYGDPLNTRGAADFSGLRGDLRVVVAECSVRRLREIRIELQELRGHATRRRQPRFTPVARRTRTRTREHRSHRSARRTASRSAGGGDDGPAEPEPPLDLARHPRYGLINPALAAFLADAEAAE